MSTCIDQQIFSVRQSNYCHYVMVHENLTQAWDNSADVNEIMDRIEKQPLVLIIDLLDCKEFDVNVVHQVCELGQAASQLGQLIMFVLNTNNTPPLLTEFIRQMEPSIVDLKPNCLSRYENHQRTCRQLCSSQLN